MIQDFQRLCVRVAVVFVLLGYVSSSTLFQFPNTQLGYADLTLYESSLSEVVELCKPRDNTATSAQWLRLAYHDMTDHDVDTGVGGLDASIQFELDNAENIGMGMGESLLDFAGTNTAFFSTADTIALGVVLGVAACGGPIIPYSAGRVDATGPSPVTVPQPQQDLATHTELFRRQGFNSTEMIALVSCGHTIGGVRQADFPQIFSGSQLAAFDSTLFSYDNTIVSEYLDGTTQDVLIVGPNVTTRSDFRIFSSDGNVTMQSLSSSATYLETCGDLLERMINTVPNGVTLTEPFSQPFEYLVTNPVFSFRDGSYTMTTTLRILNPTSNPSQTVTMLWADRQGSFCPSTGCSVSSSAIGTDLLNFMARNQGITGSRFFFNNVEINGATSISKFWFQIDNNNGSEPVVVDNGGSGYVIEQDSLFVDVLRSSVVGSTQRLVVAIQGDAASISAASMTTYNPLANLNQDTAPFLPTITTVQLQLDTTNPPDGGYTFYTGNAGTLVRSLVNLTATVNGSTITLLDYDLTGFPQA